MADFAKFYPLLLAAEGGYSTDPNDFGGETYCGVARKYWPAWPGWVLVDNAKRSNPGKFSPAGEWKLNRKFSVEVLFKNESLAAEVERFYLAEFWRPMQLDKVSSQALANQLGDHGVNASPKRAIGLAQWTLREFFPGVLYQAAGMKTAEYCRDLALDGAIGPRTLAAMNAADPAKFFVRYREVRTDFYRYRADELLGRDKRGEYLLRFTAFLRTVLAYFPGKNVTDNQLASWLSRTNAIKYPAYFH